MDWTKLEADLDTQIEQQSSRMRDDGMGNSGATSTYAQLVLSRILLELLLMAKKEEAKHAG